MSATAPRHHDSTMDGQRCRRVLVVLGPSGSGKSTVVRELHRRGVIDVTPSWTTRPRREDELDGSVEHRFVDSHDFTARQNAGYFLEVVQMFGLPYRYGLPRVEHPADGRVPAIMVRAPLMPLVARHFPGYFAYQIEDEYQRAQQRLRRRAGELGTRLDGFEEECRLGRQAAHRIFVNRRSVGDLVDAVAGAVDQDFAGHRKEDLCPDRP
jgi:guanylate kinase